MVSYRLFLVLIILIIISGYSCSQPGDFEVMFYNVENLFDTINEKGKTDGEFTPSGTKNWDSYRYWNKIKQTYQVIVAAGNEDPPSIIGFCEIENKTPLKDIIYHTNLSRFPYGFVHHESPDMRGIDVALLYRKDKMKLLYENFYKLNFDDGSAKQTREILFAKFLILEDTLHVFVTHWPSRMGGVGKSEPYRFMAANQLALVVDSILDRNDRSKILVMGDFNDQPNNKSLNSLEKHMLVNLCDSLDKKHVDGTLKYRSHWQIYDQMLVSPAFYNSKEGMSVNKESFKIFNADFLLVDDNKYGGNRPFRTYVGPRYIGGYSDHLPILLDVSLR